VVSDLNLTNFGNTAPVTNFKINYLQKHVYNQKSLNTFDNSLVKVTSTIKCLWSNQF